MQSLPALLLGGTQGDQLNHTRSRWLLAFLLFVGLLALRFGISSRTLQLLMLTARIATFGEITEAVRLTFISMTTQPTPVSTLAGGGTGWLRLQYLIRRAMIQRLQLAHAYLLNQALLGGHLRLLLLVLIGGGGARGASKAHGCFYHVWPRGGGEKRGDRSLFALESETSSLDRNKFGWNIHRAVALSAYSL